MKALVCLSCGARLPEEASKFAVPFRGGVRYQHPTWQDCQKALEAERHRFRGFDPDIDR